MDMMLQTSFKMNKIYMPITEKNVTVTVNMTDYILFTVPLPVDSSDEFWLNAVSWIYCFLFLVGLLGNSSVLVALYQMRKLLMKSRDNTFLYITALSMVDLIVILSMPLAILKIIFGHWMFGESLCQFYWLLESSGKVLSALILTALSFDRYLAICRPAANRLRQRKAAIILLLLTIFVAMFVLTPLPYKASVEKHITKIYLIHEVPIRFYRSDCVTFGDNDKESNENFKLFTICLFFVVYVFPAFCLTTFYICILRRLFSHVRCSVVHSNVPVRRVTKFVAGLLGFHFVCWTPYWLVTLCYGVYSDQFTNISDNVVLFMYFLHALPFISSGLNWIFYAVLNSRFRETYCSHTVSFPLTHRFVSHSRAQSMGRLATPRVQLAYGDDLPEDPAAHEPQVTGRKPTFSLKNMAKDDSLQRDYALSH